MNRPATLEMFVYGTLKRGGANFASYCHGALDVRPARVWGRLYALPAGYPMLAVPSESVLAVGTADRAHDLARLHALRASWGAEPPELRAHSGPWQWVSGELLSFNDDGPRLAALDELEDFRPAAAGYYDRVLVRVALITTAEPKFAAAWTYVAPLGRVPPDARWLANGCWQDDVPADVEYPKDLR